jgi:hypothetical protein
MSDELEDLADRLIGLDEEQAQDLLKRMASKLRKRRPAALSSLTRVSIDPGVYLIYHPRIEEIVYVGETGSLSQRHDDLENTENHTFRRALGNDILKT